uniref:Transposon protein, Mutator sub-class n=2 Tax=Solanum tuberosum TaxID=4113 RepID=M1AZY4_SOLTU
MAQHSQTSSEVTYSGRGLERGKRPVEYEDTSGGQTRPFKRPRMVGVGIYQAEDGFTTLNPGLPSRRVINTSTTVTKRADVVSGDIGYTPVRGFKMEGEDNYY